MRLHFGEKIYLGKISSPSANDVEFVSIFNDSESIKIGKSKEYLVKFSFESYDALKTKKVDISYDAYNSLQKQTFEEEVFLEVLLSSI